MSYADVKRGISLESTFILEREVVRIEYTAKVELARDDVVSSTRQMASTLEDKNIDHRGNDFGAISAKMCLKSFECYIVKKA